MELVREANSSWVYGGRKKLLPPANDRQEASGLAETRLFAAIGKEQIGAAHGAERRGVDIGCGHAGVG